MRWLIAISLLAMVGTVGCEHRTETKTTPDGKTSTTVTKTPHSETRTTTTTRPDDGDSEGSVKVRVNGREGVKVDIEKKKD